jgi:hypothetical protein
MSTTITIPKAVASAVLLLGISAIAPAAALAQQQSSSPPPATTSSPGDAARGAVGATTDAARNAGSTMKDTAKDAATSGAARRTSPAAERAASGSSSGDGATAGRNSFTAGQAKSRIQSMGYADVGELRKNEQGMWVGKATKSGKPVTVQLDYQGDVTANGM